ncbi:MAG: biotin--[acetyl-CoA-carboxylase] ligase [Verrucomicrobiae bacterium]|nr:biotin--[acetyl-CoA-carboxylase] ligase [Verrucomicrobiae bacterium]MCP5534448.1 biotin--[acetyl-CoA-carboxylase] ligase [Akkermansiaceae bacterium]MCP5542597.1 biotin--[acetyl-CoA-carboxylase] ligase [Akkermansiaceae bacterium]
MNTGLESIGERLPDPFRLLVRESSGSTNDDLRELATAGAPDGQILLAHRQTAGRGRRGAAWHVRPGESLAFSILVRPPEPPALWPRLALAAGLAVAEAIGSFGIQAGIKWPNDIWIAGLKVAGILVEGGPGFAIIGIGINVNTTTFPEEIASIATSLRIQGGREFPPDDVLAAVIGRFARRRLQIDAEFPELVSQIQSRCVLTGETVTLQTSSGTKRGEVEGIGGGGELLLRTGSDLERIIQADEVRIQHSA